MALERDQDGLSKAPALAGAFRAVRGELHGGDDADDLDDNDISQIFQGGRAITGKAVWSANNAARQGRDGEQERHKHEEAEEQKLRLAEWDAAMTTIGGVEMTNAEAQRARRAICNDGDRYAKWAVENGHIRHGEEEEFKATANRMYELKEAERNHGQMTEAQRHEWNKLESSHAGRAVDATSAQIHLDEELEFSQSKQAVTPSAKRDNPFPNAPPVNSHFVAAVSPAPASQETNAAPVHTPTQKPQSSAPAF